MKCHLYSVLCCIALASSGRAAPVLFTYVGDGGHQASGTLVGADNGDGTFTAVSGSGQYDGFAIVLIPNPTPPAQVTSPSGYFYYDNLMMPGQNPLLTLGGLLFSINDGGATELNIYGNGPYPANPYTAYLNNGVNDNGRLDLSLVPEPSTLSLTLVAVCMAFGVRHRQRRECLHRRIRFKAAPARSGGNWPLKSRKHPCVASPEQRVTRSSIPLALAHPSLFCARTP
jgi:hypothetical protein